MTLRAVGFCAAPFAETTMPAAARSCARTGDRSIQALPGQIGIGRALSHELPAPASPRDTRDSRLQCGQDIRQCSTTRLAVARCLVPESTQPRANARRAQPRRADRATSASPVKDSCPSRPPRCSSVRHNSVFKSTTASDTRPAPVVSALSWQKTSDGGVYLFDLRVRLHLRSLELFDFGGSILVAAAQFDHIRNSGVHRPTSLHAPW